MGVKRESWAIYDPKGAEITDGHGSRGGDIAHMCDFLDVIRGTGKLSRPIDEREKRAMMCRLSNMGYRSKTVVRCDPQNGEVLCKAEGIKFCGLARGDRAGCEPQV